MPKFAAFLRAVNLGPTRKISSADLRSMFEELGFGDVATFRTSGNVVFEAGRKAPAKLTAQIEKSLAAALGGEARVFLRSERELRALPAVLTGALAAMLAVWLGVGLAGTALVAQGRLGVTRPDELTPAVMRLLGPWAMVIAGVAVLAALMSTTASFLNLAAAAVTRDLPAAVGRRPAGVAAARIATVVVAVAAVALGIGSGRTVALLGLAGWGFFTAALLPAFVLGLAWPRATGRGVTAAIVTGGLIDLALEAFPLELPPGLEPGLAGAAVGIIVLVLVSVAFPDPGPRSPVPGGDL
jgi:Na+/proline symporter